jgi:anti-anti-sigma factor
MSETNYIASMGIGVLQMLASQKQEIGERLYISGAKARVAHILQISGVFHFYRKAESVASAIAEIKGQQQAVG